MTRHWEAHCACPLPVIRDGIGHVHARTCAVEVCDAWVFDSMEPGIRLFVSRPALCATRSEHSAKGADPNLDEGPQEDCHECGNNPSSHSNTLANRCCDQSDDSFVAAFSTTIDGATPTRPTSFWVRVLTVSPAEVVMTLIRTGECSSVRIRQGRFFSRNFCRRSTA